MFDRRTSASFPTNPIRLRHIVSSLTARGRRSSRPTVWLALFSCLLAACATTEPLRYRAGRSEAARLRKVYAQWQADRPRKFEPMGVPTRELSPEAKAAGYIHADVDSELVALWTNGNDTAGEGLAFGSVSTAEIAEWKNMGLILEATEIAGIWKFAWHAKKEPTPPPPPVSPAPAIAY
jgi:hypothetical protein